MQLIITCGVTCRRNLQLALAYISTLILLMFSAHVDDISICQHLEICANILILELINQSTLDGAETQVLTEMDQLEVSFLMTEMVVGEKQMTGHCPWLAMIDWRENSSLVCPVVSTLTSMKTSR